MKVNILVSACLLGEKVRYDGKDKHFPYLEKLSLLANIIPICPEYEVGLGIPREPIEIVYLQGRKRIVSTETKIDLTENLYDLFNALISELPPIHIVILKDGSPSCHYTKGKSLKQGLFVDQILQRFPKALLYSEKILLEKEEQFEMEELVKKLSFDCR